MFQASEIPMSLWEGQWLSSSLEFRKCMIFTMLRMKRRLVLTVGEFAPLTLTTFVAVILAKTGQVLPTQLFVLQILKASYSFFAVLKNTND